jgi:diguanylate cyclase (GGDEF)-like protein
MSDERQSVEAGTSTTSDTGAQLPSATILVVDDSTAIRRIIGRTLVHAGYRVIEAADGQAGLDAIRAEHPDLVLLDVDMPVMDGPAALRVMRADPEMASLPVLFLTARTGGADVAAGLDLGAQDYLRKPCEPEELTARVARALRAKVNEDALDRRVREMNRMSTTDALTGLGNRRRAEAMVREATEQSGPDTALTVILCDIDRFKTINDQYGHPVGDAVLSMVAERLTSAAGVQPVVTRWGGEEFLVTAVGLDAVRTVELAERLRSAIAETPFAVSADRRIPVTISAGCAIAAPAEFVAALEAADAALYRAKRAGRDRVTAAWQSAS